jgi:nucleotide-binding universal stress UspA family protein
MTETLLLHDIPRGGVVVGVDGSDGSDEAVDWAADAAARQHRTLVVVHTEAPQIPWNASGYPAASIDPAVLDDSVLAAGRIYTGAATERALARHADLEVLEVADLLDPRLGLATASERAHLLVVGSRGRGPVASLLLGSVSLAVSRHASCPVVVVRPGEGGGSRVLALVDGKNASLAVLEHAAQHASEVGQPLHVWHLMWTAFDIDGNLAADSERLLAEISAGLGEKFPDVTVTTEITHFVSPEAMVRDADDASYVVVGHAPASRLHQLLYRSVSAAVLEHAEAPVGIVPTTSG